MFGPESVRRVAMVGALTLAAGLLSAGSLSRPEPAPTPAPGPTWQFVASAGMGDVAPEMTDTVMVAQAGEEVRQTLAACVNAGDIKQGQEGMTHCLSQALESAINRGVPAPVVAQVLHSVVGSSVELAGPCHSVGHGFGRYAYKARGLSALGPGLADCGFGYYHGVLEGIGDTKNTELLVEQARAVCGLYDGWQYTQCVHGVGHAVSHAVDVPQIREICQQVANNPEGLRECFNGGLMQWSLFNPGLRLDKVKQTCVGLSGNEETSCFGALTSMLDKVPDVRALSAECAVLVSADAALGCWRAVGVNTSRLIVVYGIGPEVLTEMCPSGNSVCIDEAGFFFVSDSMDVRRSTTLCSTVSGRDRETCLAGIARAVDVFGKDLALQRG
jgi:hypothetical protein